MEKLTVEQIRERYPQWVIKLALDLKRQDKEESKQFLL